MLVFGGVLFEEDDAPGKQQSSPARSDFSWRALKHVVISRWFTMVESKHSASTHPLLQYMGLFQNKKSVEIPGKHHSPSVVLG